MRQDSLSRDQANYEVDVTLSPFVKAIREVMSPATYTSASHSEVWDEIELESCPKICTKK